ncbi:MAG: TlpA family protein disulfide reductase [Clostridiales bacterium]|nr:TlpA family protein disulfide reductase [Clostridiales bacterium]
MPDFEKPGHKGFAPPGTEEAETPEAAQAAPAQPEVYRMSKKATIVWSVLGLIMLAILGTSFYDHLILGAKYAKDYMPNFGFEDAEGNEFRLEEFLGKPLVINFWSSKCYPCVQEMPDFQKAFLEYGDEVQFLMINIADGVEGDMLSILDTKANALIFIESNGYTMPFYFDTKSQWDTEVQITGFPYTFFVRADGYVGKNFHRGRISEADLIMEINKLLSDESGDGKDGSV